MKTKAILSGDVPASLVGRHVFAPDKKDGKEHRYRSLIENKRVSGGRQPEPELSLLLDQLKLDLPAQPPPKISPAAVTPASPL